MILNNQNDMYLYFQMINELQPDSVLDAGMFLKRAGSVSRQMMGCGISEDVRLDGIDFFPELQLPVWKNIYNKIYQGERLSEIQVVSNYDLGILLGSDSLKGRVSCEELLLWMGSRVSRLLVDSYLSENVKKLSDVNVQEITVEGEVYYFIDYRSR